MKNADCIVWARMEQTENNSQVCGNAFTFCWQTIPPTLFFQVLSMRSWRIADIEYSSTCPFLDEKQHANFQEQERRGMLMAECKNWSLCVIFSVAQANFASSWPRKHGNKWKYFNWNRSALDLNFNRMKW